jgi:hypothetical protein
MSCCAAVTYPTLLTRISYCPLGTFGIMKFPPPSVRTPLETSGPSCSRSTSARAIGSLRGFVGSRTPGTGTRVCPIRRYHKSQDRLPGFSLIMETCRSRQPHSEGRQGGVREVAIVATGCCSPNRDNCSNQAITLTTQSMSVIAMLRQFRYRTGDLPFADDSPKVRDLVFSYY